MNSLIDFDREMLKQGTRIAGLDEAGRGALAGPVFVGCIVVPGEVLTSRGMMDRVNDSKQLSEVSREELFAVLSENEKVEIGIGQSDNREIDEAGINEAANLAATRAFNSCSTPVDLLLLDSGLVVESESTCETETMEKGDERSFHIAAASILAKVARDRYMRSQAADFPGYGWKTNVGYGTEEHRQAVKANGLTSLHRKSYNIR